MRQPHIDYSQIFSLFLCRDLGASLSSTQSFFVYGQPERKPKDELH